MTHAGRTIILFGTVWVVCCAPRVLGADPWADAVVSYDPGSGAAEGYTDPAVVLGTPERYTGEGVWPGVVSMFNPAWGADEIVSIGDGGQLTVRFDEPITDDPSHLYGVDLIIFGNAGFIDVAYPNGQIGDPAGMFGADPAVIEVSADGVTFFEIPDVFADALFPTQGYLDSGPYDASPGSEPADFLRPMNPSLSLSDFDGLSYAEALALYDGSGGGAPVDLAWAVDSEGQPAGLTQAWYVRIRYSGPANAEIDAFAVVPEPGVLVLVLGGVVPVWRKKWLGM